MARCWRVAIFFVGLTAATAKIEVFPSFYHTTEQTYAAFDALATKCAHLTLSNVGTAPVLLVATFDTSNTGQADIAKNKAAVSKAQGVMQPIVFKSLRGQSDKKKTNMMLLFGEHAREFVTVELSLRLAEDLCFKHPETKEMAQQVLEKFAITIVPIGNPLGHQVAENGDFCYRANENGIDLNRNWDAHWTAQTGEETNSGSGPFSEPETQSLKGLVDSLQPHVFVTVHSGTFGMYTPFAYSIDEPTDAEEAEMLAILGPLDAEHCQCPMGAAGKEVGYLCPGTCLDYAHDNAGSKYAFAFEIYGNEEEKALCKSTYEKQLALQSAAPNSNSNSGMDFATIALLEMEGGAKHSSFLSHRQASSAAHLASMGMDDCFSFFNPPTQELLTENTLNWANVLLKLALKVPVSDAPIASAGDAVEVGMGLDPAGLPTQNAYPSGTLLI